MLRDPQQLLQELQAKTAFFEAVADSPLDGILVVDNLGHIIHQNARIRELWQLSSVTSQNNIDSNDGSDIRSASDNVNHFVEGVRHLIGNPSHIGRDEIELIDGTILERYTAPVKNSEGIYYGRVWTFRDITQRKLAERVQSESLQRLEKIASRLPGFVYQFRLRPDGTSCFPYCSEGLYNLFGVRPAEVIEDSTKAFAYVHPEDFPLLQAAIAASAVDLSPWQLEFRVRFENGEEKWMSGNSVPEREPDGSTLWHGYIHDVTATKRSANELKAAKDLLEEAQAVARLGNWTYDLATGRIRWSKEQFKIFGYAPTEGEPDYRGFLECFAPEDAKIIDDAVKTAVSNGTPYSLVLKIRNPDSVVKHVRCEGRTRRDSTGEIVELYGTAMDVTAEVEREIALEIARRQADTANRAKSEFLANMSHEIRTPLTAILGFTEVLREDGNIAFAPPRRLETMDTITNAGRHLLSIINDVLDLSKIEADKTSIERIETSLPVIMREVENLLQPKAAGKGVTLEARLATPVPSIVLSDPTRLRQILMNLVGNSVKFTEAGHVTLTGRFEEFGETAALIVDVEDTGPGMTPEQAGLLFQPFEQADSTVTRKHGGTGLGLTISRRLANLMGGDVTLLRSDIGRGSCFRLEFPAVLPHGALARERVSLLPTVAIKSDETSTRLHGRILLAEDGLDNQKLIAFILRKAGAIVEVADDGQTALLMFDSAESEGNPFNMLLTDIQMPIMDGYALARALRLRGSELPIVALTAHALSYDRQKCLDAGCSDYITKPIDRRTLLDVCAKWIGLAVHCAV